MALTLKNKILIIGAGAFGTAIASCLQSPKNLVTILARGTSHLDSSLADNDTIKNCKMESFATFQEDFYNFHLIILAVPCQSLRNVCEWMCEHFTKFKDNSARKIRTKKLNIISASKGIEQKTLFLPHEILKRIWNEKANVGALSGPSFAQEMREGLPTCVVIASRSQILLTKATAILHNPYFRIYDTKDIMGVEIAGALKNIIAIVSGAVDGLNLGHNARAAVMTRGLAEIVRIGVFLGAEPLTFLGLSGVGDLILTCTGHLSRNRQFGYRMTQGESVADILKSTHQVVEGIATAKSAYELCQKHKIDSPILSAVYKVLYEDFPLRDAISLFIEREHGKEFKWKRI